MKAQPAQFFQHGRDYGVFRYVYPVISRRARGLSIGLNLNPDKVCNWDCPYCQVDRVAPPAVKTVDETRLFDELDALLDDVESGALWEQPRFFGTPQGLRVLRDIALAGDGEPTSYAGFASVVRGLIELRARRGLQALPVNVLTNATLFHLPRVREGLELLESIESDLWVKLDAGSEAYFQAVNVSRFSLEHCLRNIAWAASRRPVTIQSMFFALDGAGPGAAEIDAWLGRIRWMLNEGARFRRVQVYTIARRPASDRCQPLSDAQVDAIGERARSAFPEIPAETFYGRNSTG